MATLVWDKPGERFYQMGVDRGVLFLPDGSGIAWNGLIGVEDNSKAENRSFYLEGAKFLEIVTPGDFSGKLKAFTYPEEFDSINGIGTVVPGFNVYEQPPKHFSLSYRTLIGNDIDGTDHGYKIHILYNLVANPETIASNTLDDSNVQPIEFSWGISGIPEKIENQRPAVHVSIDSRQTPVEIMKYIEDHLYGTAVTEAQLPSIQQLSEYFGYQGSLIIIDYGDGTWSAIDESNGFITMLNETTFSIDGANATYLDADTYEISSTNVD